MMTLEPGKLRRSTKCCIYWLTGPCCLLSQKVLLFSVFLITFPRTSQEQKVEVQNDLMSSSVASSSEESSSNHLLDSLITSMSPQTLSSSTLPPEIGTVAPPPAFKQPLSPARSRSSARNRGGDQQHGHHHPKSNVDTSVLLSTPLGKIRGRSYYINKTGEWVGGFLGIPYAQPPMDQLRFRPPVGLPSLTNDKKDIFNATDFGAICIQPGDQKIWDVFYLKSNRTTVRKRKLDNYNMSEDCLTINIYVPLKAHLSVPTEPVLPVFFFIHGGSYYMNAGRLYPGQILASAQNLIVVTFNYRLGPLGFLSTEDQAAPGNYGLLDQALALDWVYQNIQHFGGDPSRITLVGNSAGAASVMFHMFSDLSKGKFIGITVQSGCSGAPWAIQNSPKRHAEDLATKLGCPTFPTSDMVSCIRNFSPEAIMKNAQLEDGLSLAYATVIDGKYGGKFLMNHPDTLIRSRSFHIVPVLAGFTKDEVTIWFTKFGPTIKMSDLRTFVHVDVASLMENLQTVTPANTAAMIHSVTVQYLYRTGAKENDTFGKTTSISDLISDVGLKAPCIKEMNLFAKFTQNPVFLYEFVYFSVDDIKMNKQDWIGAYHESELQFVFGEAYMNYTNHLRSFDDKKMSDYMMKIWGNFARFGNPNGNVNKHEKDNGLKFTWTTYSEYTQDFAVLGLKSHMSKYFLTDRMLFWNFFFPIFRDYPFRLPKPSCDEWGIISNSWSFWALLLVTMALGFALSMLIMVRLKRKLFRRIRRNNNTNTTGSSSSAVTASSGINHNHHSSSPSSSSINHRHCSSQHRSNSLLRGQQHGNGGGGGENGGSSCSSSNLLHGANGTRILSTSTNNNGSGSNLPINT